jgi:hypothetical protein
VDPYDGYYLSLIGLSITGLGLALEENIRKSAGKHMGNAFAELERGKFNAALEIVNQAISELGISPHPDC